MHENVRLSVERSRHSWSCPVKRLRPSGAERARAAMAGAPAEPSGLDFGDVGRCNAFEPPGRTISSALAGSSSHFERPVEPSGLERPFRAPQRSRAGSSGHFERPSGAERARCRKRRQVRCFRARPSEFERPFRAPQRSRAGSSGYLERPSGLEVGNVGRCGVCEAGRGELSSGACGGPRRPAEIFK